MSTISATFGFYGLLAGAFLAGCTLRLWLSALVYLFTIAWPSSRAQRAAERRHRRRRLDLPTPAAPTFDGGFSSGY